MSLYRLGGDGLGCSPAQQALGVMEDARLTISPHVVCSPHKANHILWWEKQGQQMEGSYPSLLGTGEAAPGIACSILAVVLSTPLFPPAHSKKDVEESGEDPAAGY